MSSLLDAPPSSHAGASLGALAATAAAYGALIALISSVATHTVTQPKRAVPVTEMVEVELPKPPSPTLAPESEPRASAPRVKAAEPAAPKTSPAAAEAGQVLDARSEPVDFGDTFVVGSGEQYAGGTTDSAGTSKEAVRGAAARGDEANVVAKTMKAPDVDLSKPARLMGSAEWRCPFPPEADDAGVDHAVVTLRVEVGVDGALRSTQVVSDPGDGFGREARRCALGSRWLAPLDRAGRPTAGSATVNVRFDR